MLFDELFEEHSIIKQAIQEKIDEEVLQATAQRNEEIATLKTTVDELTATILMGGM